MRWKMKQIAAAAIMAGTLLVMSSPFAQAQTQTFKITFDTNGDAAGFADGDFYNQVNPAGFLTRLVIPKFDPSQGTLTSVELSLTTEFYSSLTLTRVPANGNVAGNASVSTQTTLSGVPASPAFTYQADTTEPFLIPDGQQATTVNLDTSAVPASGGLSQNYTVAGFPVFTATFVGTGDNTDLSAQITSTPSDDTADATVTDETTQARLVGTVTYNFEISAVPEPSSLLMLAPVAGGVALRVRARRRKSAAK